MIRRLSVYETKSRFYLVGSDGPNKNHSVLKVDRTEASKLVLSHSGHTYNAKELNELLYMIHGGNYDVKPEKTAKGTQAASSSMTERHKNAFGLLGFVRFTKGYYILLVTKASKVAQLGYHGIYKVEDVSMIEVEAIEKGHAQSPDELRYVKAFQSVDLSTHFYFAYSYDLSHTLQENLNRGDEFLDVEEKFVWNRALMSEGLRQGLPRKWFMPLIHGYVGQASVQLPSTRLGLILVARRSNKYAGTRFLKRGANFAGHPGNEVETEQILYSESGPQSALLGGRYTAFVQHRASVPLVWSQDPANRPPVVTGKPPPISLDLREPWAEIPALHFRDLLVKYGSPVVALNLCKRRERRPHESLLNDEFRRALAYLNQFLPPDRQLLYLSFDMARCNKAGNVLPKLEEIAIRCVRRTAWFQSFPPLAAKYEIRPSPLAQGIVHKEAKDGLWRLQSGVARTNCVDCLDRTNVAQLVMGRVALGFQLYSLGLLQDPTLPMETELCRVLESLYEEHGDTMALQYAGSHLVHSLKTYQKTAALQERSRDVIQTLSRYYSNTFADYDKQSAINLFLGLYKPMEMGRLSLWDLATDLQLHNPGLRPRLDYCEWFLPDPTRRLPVFAVCGESGREVREELDDYELYYRTYELSSLDLVLARRSGDWKRVRLEGTKAESASGQFSLRLWKRQTDSTPPEKPSGAESTPPPKKGSDGGASESSDSAADNSDTEIRYAAAWLDGPDGPATAPRFQDADKRRPPFRFRDAFPSEKQVYGIVLRQPSTADMAKYETYAALSGGCGPPDASRRRTLANPASERPLKSLSVFTQDSTFGAALPVVSKSALAIYSAAVRCCDLDKGGPREPSARDRATYASYAASRNGIAVGAMRSPSVLG